jgi:hypothetical protein
MTPEINTFDQELVPRNRAWCFLGLLASGFAFWCVLSFLLPHDRYIRYQQLTDSDLFRSRWVYERIHYDPTPIDVAIIGSSRVEAAISAPVLARELSAKLGRTIHVANLAIPQEGRNLHYLIARELIVNHPETRLILLSVVEQADTSHFAFRYLADPGDLVRAPLLVNHYYFLDAAFLPYRQMSYFVQTLFPGWFNNSRSFRDDYMGTGFDTTYSFHLPSGKLVDRYHVMPPTTKPSAEAAWYPPSRWQALNNPLETEYTMRLAGVAASHSVQIVFVHLPAYNSRPGAYDEAFYHSLGPVLDAQQLSGNANYYGDPGHFNRYGTEQVSPWLNNAIEPYLAPLQNGPLQNPTPFARN